MKFTQNGNQLIGQAGVDTIWIEPWGKIPCGSG